MATDDLRMRFLKEGARLLSISSPTTAATLGAARGRLLQMQDSDIELPTKEWDAFRREVCGACGNLMLPGWSSDVSQQSRPKKTVKGAETDTSTKPTRQEKDKVYTCLRCNRKTVQPLAMVSSRHTRKARTSKMDKPVSAVLDAIHGDKNKVVKSSNASSKLRAKARKGGLQALLAQSKAPSSQGLDLMDFMS